MQDGVHRRADDQDANIQRREIEKGFMMMTFNRFAYIEVAISHLWYSRDGICTNMAL